MNSDIRELLRANPYPGRGMILGCSRDGYSGDGRSSDGRAGDGCTGDGLTKAGRSIAVYFIMGRSENSRNRVFEKTSDGIRTKAFDPLKLTDPSLVIYHPVRVLDGRIIVTNGIQTDTIKEHLVEGGDFRTALHEWEYEPDPPIWTPRISGLIDANGSYMLSILKKADETSLCCARYFYEYSSPIPGTGHFISTYMTDGSPPPPFAGEPIAVTIPDNIDLNDFAASLWASLNENNRVSLYARETVIATGESNDVIINRWG